MTLFNGRLPRDPIFLVHAYGASLRDNFDAIAPTESTLPQTVVKLNQLKTDFDVEMRAEHPEFSALLRIEMALVDLSPDPYVLQRFWSVEDRFNRVLPAGTRASYQATSPQRGDPQWTNADFVRRQTKSLLDSIHSNYLINMAREKAIKCLKIIMLSVILGAGLVAAVFGWLFIQGVIAPVVFGFSSLIFMGTLGAVLSITRRLQDAVVNDAMAADGIFELMGLGLGWAGLFLSIATGGAFALVIYFIAEAGVLSAAYPVLDTDTVTQQAPPATKGNKPPPAPAPTAPTGSAANSSLDGTDASASDSLMSSESASTPETPTGSHPKDEPAVGCIQSTKGFTVLLDPVTYHCVQGNSEEDIKLLAAMRLKSMQDYFKMLILAFLAGFAERFVPDILNRMTKQRN